MKRLYTLFVPLFSIFLTSYINAQPTLIGSTFAGGDGVGTIFKTDVNGDNHQLISTFSPNTEGAFPMKTKLCQISTDIYYGITRFGGAEDLGVIFEYNYVTNTYVKKFEFDGINGAEPDSYLIKASNGKLYGMTTKGGANKVGVIFEYDYTNNTFNKKVDLTGSTGPGPYGFLMQAANGKLYGLTKWGGVNNKGVLFEYNYSNNTFTVKYEFGSVDSNGTTGGYNPKGTLVEGSNGKLYGVSSGGSQTFSKLNIFEYNYTTNVYAEKVTTTYSDDGMDPCGSLIKAGNNKMYGLNQSGGTNNKGVLFEYDYIKNIYLKKINIDTITGNGPLGGLFEASNGKLYGMTRYGGATNSGVLFEYDYSTNTCIKKIDFGRPKGFYPFGYLIQAPNGKLLGITKGGIGSCLIFEYDYSTDSYANKIDLNHSPNGCFPNKSLTVANNGKVYGSTTKGGAYGMGVLFEYDYTSKSYTKKYDFDASTQSPNTELIQANNGKLYGTTEYGGANNQGLLFEYDYSADLLTKKMDFSDTTPNNSNIALRLASNGKLYGITYSAVNKTGVLFEYDYVNNIYTKKINLDSTNGFLPSSSLIEGEAGKLYGTTAKGGYKNLGVIFEYDLTTNLFTKKIDLDSAKGFKLNGSLIKASNGKFYGVTSSGGMNNLGVLFEYDYRSNTFIKKYDADSINTIGRIMESSNNKLYGVTFTGGVKNYGVIFEYDYINNTYFKKIDFNGENGMNRAGNTNGNGKANNNDATFYSYYGTLVEICPKTVSNINIFSCNSYTSPSGKYTWTISGAYKDTIPNSAGCDSVITINLTINSTSSSINTAACNNYTSPSGKYTWTTNGIYNDTIPNSVSCDSIITINLTIKSTDSSVSATTCNSYISPSGKYTWTISGTYNDTIPNSASCDSVITLNLSVKNNSSSSINVTDCNSYSSPSGKYIWTTSGTYVDTILNSRGCDSVITINLSIINGNSSSSSISATACNSYNSPSSNYIWTTSGTYNDTIPNAALCDSVITVNLTINSTSSSINATACNSYYSPSGKYTWTTSGTFIDTIPNSASCDSVITVNLTINSTSSSINATACNSYISPSGKYIWTTSGSYTDTIPNSALCDSVITVNLIIKNSSINSISATACNSYNSPSGKYTWTTSGTYNDTIPNAALCDSVITVNLTIINGNNSSSSISATACNSYNSPSGKYIWTTSGTYNDTVPSSIGCDSIITVNLIINSTSSSINATACNTYYSPSGKYTWTTSGTYMDTIPNSATCDSVITVNLIIKNSSSSNISATACNSYTSPSGKYTWTTSGTYNDTVLSSAGCDSVITINLTMNSTSSNISATACNTYTSPSGKYTWTTSGTFIDTIPNSASCDSVITVNLIIKNSSSNNVNATVCNSYTSPSGKYKWTISGTYNDTIPNSIGCDSVITVSLIIKTIDTSVVKSEMTLTANATGASYQWLDCNNSFASINGETNQSYTAPANGDYAVELNSNGCTDTSVCTVITLNCFAHYTVTKYDTLQNNFTLVVDSLTTAFANSYYWDFGDGNTSTLATPTHAYAIDTVYNVCLKITTASNDSCAYCHIIGKDYLGNVYRTSGFTINVINPNLQTGVSSILSNENSFIVFPNPTSGETEIMFNRSVNNINIKVFNVTGQKILEKTSVSGNRFNIDISNQTQGIYFIEILSDNNVLRRKLIKE